MSTPVKKSKARSVKKPPQDPLDMIVALLVDVVEAVVTLMVMVCYLAAGLLLGAAVLLVVLVLILFAEIGDFFSARSLKRRLAALEKTLSTPAKPSGPSAS